MISVIIPIYNASTTIKKILESLLQQTEQDYEVIMVDDGSIDDSADICQRIARQDTRFRYIHQKNAGVSAARNRGLQAAGGDFIAFLDADDVIAPNYLSELLCTCEGVDIAVCDVVVREGETDVKRFTHAPCLLTQSEALNALLIRQTINSGPYAKMFCRKTLESLSFPPLKAYEDILFVKDAFSRAHRIAVTNRTEYVYIQNPKGAMSGFIKAPSLDIVKATDELLSFFCSRRDLSPHALYITASHLMQYVQALKDVSIDGTAFISNTQKLYRKYKLQIMKCSAFPWKEKIVYFAFAFGWKIEGRKFRRIK